MNKFMMLDINLTLRTAEPVDVTDLFREYIGGTGVATALLEKMDPTLDPYSPKAQVIFAMGSFSSVFPVATKTVAMFRSPLTGNLGESHAGGRLAMAMFGAGYHVIRITGACDELSVLEITDEKVKFHAAGSLKGMAATSADRVLRDRFSSGYKRSIMRIGPAGERLSQFAAVTVDASRHFGRLGLGGVLGAKKIKAIITSGGKYWKLESPGSFNKFYSKLYNEVVGSDVMKKYHNLGTAVSVIPLSKINGLPTRNFSQGFFEGANQISGETFAEKNLSQQIACAHCQCGCIHMATVRECFNKERNLYKTFKVSYDHELVFALGSNLSINSSDDVLRLLQIVEKQGWDAISIGVVLSWAVEAFQRGIISTEQTDGLVLNFGDTKMFEVIMANIASGTNEFYSDLEKGALFCAEKYGGKEFAIVFGGNEAPGYMTGLHAYLGYATGVRHSHLDSAGYSLDQKKINTTKSDDEWTRELLDEAVWRVALNSLVICLFARNIYTPEIVCEGLALTGLDGFTPETLAATARKIHAMKNRLKKSFGFSFDRLYMPSRLEKAVTTCGSVSCEEFNRQVAVYRDLCESDMALYKVK